jgi:hypothetical protein
MRKNLAETQYWTKTLQRLNIGQKPSRDSILDKNLADSILDKNLPETQYWTKTFQRLNIGQKPSRDSILDKNLYLKYTTHITISTLIGLVLIINCHLYIINLPLKLIQINYIFMTLIIFNIYLCL